MSFFQDKALDHGCFSPLSVLLPHDAAGWPVPIVPLQVGVLQFPVPSAARCFRLGQSLRGAIESFPEDIGVVIVATGGLSHQIQGERAGFNNPLWDHQLMELMAKDPVALTKLTQRVPGFVVSTLVALLVARLGKGPPAVVTDAFDVMLAADGLMHPHRRKADGTIVREEPRPWKYSHAPTYCATPDAS